jgi:hypothetical protein
MSSGNSDPLLDINDPADNKNIIASVIAAIQALFGIYRF